MTIGGVVARLTFVAELVSKRQRLGSWPALGFVGVTGSGQFCVGVGKGVGIVCVRKKEMFS